ncbi:hypothetical protein G9A89_001628 [Geosiphon pyriformis]|nr:hypothetical protein G9A89_001628 [Geosiphon pyriformis]
MNTNFFEIKDFGIISSIKKYLRFLHESRNLLALRRVCQLFAEYLNTDTSNSTELIWRQARQTYLPTFILGLPDRMSEREYCEFIVGVKCQNCNGGSNRGHNAVRHSFQFMVRFYKHCFIENKISGTNTMFLKFQAKYNLDYPKYLKLLQFLLSERTPKNHGTEYFRPRAIALMAKYKNFSNKSRKQNRLIKKYRRYKEKIVTEGPIGQLSFMNKVQTEREEKEKLKRKRKEKIEEYISDLLKETAEDRSLKWNIQQIESHCKALNRARNSNATHEFTPRAWTILRHKIEAEYPKNQPLKIILFILTR